MNRFNTLKSFLDNENCFKMICGAGNEDISQVKKLAFVYTLAGAAILDISANVGVVKAAKEGIDLAMSQKDISIRPFIMVSIGMPGDHHVRKSVIDPNTCIGCNLCIPVCPTEAIPEGFTKQLDLYNLENEIVIKDLCIGCGKCSNICPKKDVISYRHSDKELRELLPKCIDAGAELFELHAAVGDEEVTLKEWELINSINPDNFNSMCLDRLNLGNLNLEHRIMNAKKISGDRLIIQADGYPMSGGENDYNTTLQAVATADVINKKFNMRIDKKNILGTKKSLTKRVYRESGHKQGVYVILSGGTNSFTKELAKKCGVRCNGVAIGTFARNIISKYIDNPDFYDNQTLIETAVSTAKKLINENNDNSSRL